MNTIRARLLVTFMVVVFVTLGLIWVTQTAWLERYLMNDKARMLENQLASVSQFTAVYVRRPENLPVVAQSLLKQFSAFSSGDLALYDHTGQLVSSTARSAQYSASVLLTDLDRNDWPRRHVYRSGAGRWLSVSTPVGSPPVGFVTQTVPLDEMDLALAATSRRLIFATMLALTGAGIVSLFLANSLTRPISHLRDAAIALAGGNLSVRLKSDRGDELGVLARSVDHMADRIEQNLAASEADRRRLSAILTNLSEGLIAFDGENRVLMANPAAARLLGVRIDELPGRPAATLLPGGRMEPVLRTARESKGLYAHELDWPFEEGTTVRVTCAPLEIESGDGLVMTLRNTTDLRRLEERRQEFMSRLSHELRTPLTIIKGYLVTLLDTPDKDLPAERESLVILDREADRLARMVEELLEFSRQRSALLRLNIAPERLDEVIRESVSGMRNQAARSGVALSVSAPDEVPPVPMSRDHVKQVLLNLLDNAVKYNKPGGKVTVSLEVIAGGLSVSVDDTGRGIPPEDLPFIFDRFFRGARTPASGGSGLGLAIVKEIVEAHGGEITVSSSGEGTTVRFVLPR